MAAPFGRNAPQDRAHLDTRAKQGAGLQLLQARHLAQVVILLFRRHVHHLAARHALVPARPREHGNEFAAHEGIGADIVLRQDIESERVQRIARQHRGRLVEGAVDGRLAMAQFVIVHAGQIVMDQGIGMDRFDRAACGDRGGTVDAIEIGDRHDEQRAHPLAATDGGVAHRFDQARAAVVWHRQIRVEGAVDILLHPRQRGFQQIVARKGIHRGHESASKGAVPLARPCPSVTIFSIRACAASSRAWQCVRKASPRS